MTENLVLVPVQPPYATTVIEGVTYVLMQPGVLRKVLSSPAVEAEPVAWLNPDNGAIAKQRTRNNTIPLYTHTSSPVSAEVTVTDEMVERAARAIASTAYDGIFFTTRSREQYVDAEWRHHETDARTALAALNGGRENG